MITMRGLGPVSSTMGIAMVRDFRTISIGRMSGVSIGLIGFIVLSSAVLGRSLTAVTVMSARGAFCKIDGSGDMLGSGVGIGGGSSFSGATSGLITLFRFLGAAFLTGSSIAVAVDITVVSGSSTSEASVGAMLLFGRPRALGAAVAAAGAIDLRERVCLRGLLVWGANSSSSSAACLVIVVFISSSEESTTVRLVAARREGRDEAADMIALECLQAPQHLTREGRGKDQ